MKEKENQKRKKKNAVQLETMFYLRKLQVPYPGRRPQKLRIL